MAILSALLLAASPASSAGLDALAHRLLGARADHVRFVVRSEQGKDRYAVDAYHGRVTIQATSIPSAARGLYDYLKRGRPGTPGSIVNWDGSRLDLGTSWWDAKLEGVSPAKWRHDFNVCTFGYTTAFWGWREWERELDWMALHGINLPLAMVGQEAVWQRVWLRHGLTDGEIRSFFGGAAFLPWHRMGNIDAHAGPLPQSWIDGQAELQRRILRRMRELGMKPVLPAFSGFLPPAFAAKNPSLKTRKSTAWAGFAPTVLLDPRDPLFPTLGKEFIDTYRSMFGVDGYYLADVFNEMTPQVDPATKLEDLRETAKGVYDAIRASDPNGVWVTQGWLFYNESTFWKEPEIAAYLSGVPSDKILLLDLFCDNTEIWRRSPAFRQRPYIWNMLHNFGGRTPLFGDFQGLIDRAAKALDDPAHGQLAGMGLTMEGIHQNPAIYELMTDLMWNRPKSASEWYEAFLAARWGDPSAAREFAGPLLKAFYSGQGGRLMPYQERPSLAGPSEGSPIPDSLSIVRHMLDRRDLLANQLYRDDVVDVMRQAAGDAITVAIANAVEDLSAHKSSEEEGNALALMALLDVVTDQPTLDTLPKWQEMAEACVSPEDRTLLRTNARLQVTQWGGPDLSEYAAKEWHGLISGYYLPRWRMAFEALRRGETDEAKFRKDLMSWEDAWIKAPPTRSQTAMTSDWETVASTLLSMVEKERPHAEGDLGVAVGKKATDSGGTEPGGDPSKAVDGRIGGGWWSASPFPQWWQVDLGEPVEIGRVQVFTYYGDGRIYRYTVETSLDGKTWTQAADMSKNAIASNRRGFEHRFAPRLARYVRVNMLFNSANVGVHLREVRVFVR